VLALPSQARGVREQYGLTRAETDRAAWAITRDGRRLEGAPAVNAVLRELGGGWRILASALETAGPLESGGYRWFARNRGRFARFGIAPECEDPAAECDPD
jgi:predicted DCC family thiol-disulfide oxidoreductase YuxK